jgi:CheY-like chemotaxis protein
MSGTSKLVAPRILVVDDHAVSREYTVAALRTIGAAVKQAGNGMQALQLALEWLPQLVLLDVQLPDSGGVTLSRRIRDRWPSGAERPYIVLISAARLPTAGSDGAADGFLRKPVAPEDLRAWVSLQPSGTLREGAAEAGDGGLHELFRRELQLSIDQVDQRLARLDLDGAAAILHQLVASSAMCQEKVLERKLRVLYRCCRDGAAEATLARAYYELRRSAAASLRQAGRAGLYSG